MEFPAKVHASDIMESPLPIARQPTRPFKYNALNGIPVGAAICAFVSSIRRSHNDTVPFEPAVQTRAFDSSNALAQVMWPCAVRIVFMGPWLSLVGSKRERIWSEEMAAKPPVTGMISKT